ncbi:hypothetical protein H6G89_34135 [Oscillatoria sp. FACHB-1407]|uniref:hypothetical protein n=1 Tax=Oscillatoria sp. FACHB-1407 TaxID=2692847 RepID=UPI0016839573|nr:hypothetical protein [Oscillatoria sp. FACHB-1407]MBD2466027.1 hypothetical protein [Oscillatoria sp. FACHB-1407]
MRPLRLLFDSPQAAREVAFMLRCEYDGCTLISLPSMHDTVALRTAIELVGAEFCFEGDHYPLVLPPLEGEGTEESQVQRSQQMSRKAQLWCDEVPF